MEEIPKGYETWILTAACEDLQISPGRKKYGKMSGKELQKSGGNDGDPTERATVQKYAHHNLSNLVGGRYRCEEAAITIFLPFSYLIANNRKNVISLQAEIAQLQNGFVESRR
eukprot:TRINITY_DN18426_c0_g1_i1.p1 TRINITY_DN18426_c0_g1~~TRINITY_DN18426_c0_g1_i1.p1  ORF type:complete len:113 (-),score=18.99 TRINITY_DN18426_c0_g1_i1:95-433(-)